MLRLCAFLKYIQNSLNVHHRVFFYDFYKEPVISYGLLVYGSTNKNNLQPIFLKEKRKNCMFFNESKIFHTSPLTEKANIFAVHEVSLMQLLQYKTDNIIAFSQTVIINTRNSNLELFEPKLYRKQIMKLLIEHQPI